MPPLTIDQAFQLALQHHKAGRLAEAEPLYRQILANQPAHAEALHFLGVIAYQVGRNDMAVDLIRRAIVLNPDSLEAYNNLGNALKNNRQPEEAAAAYRQAIALNPGFAEAHYNLGNALQDVGRPNEAIAAYRQAIALQFNYPDAHSNLGNVLRGQGFLDAAIDAYQHAVAVNPNFPGGFCNLGNALKDKGQLDDAIAAHRQAIALNPSYADAHNNLGNALREQEHLDEAVNACRQALALNPGLVDAHLNLGNILRDQGHLEAAIAAYQQAIALNPNFARAYNNLGNALRESGNLDEAVAACRRAVTLEPNYAEAHNNLGNALKESGRLDEAITAYRQAIALQFNDPKSHNNLGSALGDKGNLDEAAAAYRQAIALQFNYPEAHSNLGIVLKDQGQLEAAIADHRQAIALNPKYPEAHNNLGNAMKDAGQLDEAIAAYRQAIAVDPDYTEAHSNLILTLHYHPGSDAKIIADELLHWNRRHAEPMARYILPHANDRNPGRRLRIGYVSPDFVSHPVGRFLLPLLESHNRQQVEVFAYAQVLKPDVFTDHLRARTDHWRTIFGLSDEQAVQLIRNDQIDILVDLAMHTANNRLLLFARKPAPVQITYLAYSSTTGLSTIDYRFSDPYLDPPGADESVYSEETLRLPQTYWCYRPMLAPAVGSVPAFNAGHITFGCLNNFCKVTAPALAAWAHLLQAIPGAKLLLHAPQGSHRQRAVDIFQKLGVGPQRLHFAATVPLAQYLELYQQIDIALDPFPYGGGTTTCDALWMGVPVISLAGPNAFSRSGVSILSNIGLPELVASSQEHYVQLAAALANDLPRLSNLRSTLRDRMQSSPLMDAKAFAGNVESAYRLAWQQWCAAQRA